MDAPITEKLDTLTMSYGPGDMSGHSLLLYGGYYSNRSVFMDSKHLNVEMKVANSSVADGLRGLFLASLFDDNTSPTTVNVILHQPVGLRQ